MFLRSAHHFLKRFWAPLLFILTVVILPLNASLAADYKTLLYDNFNDGVIDKTKWKTWGSSVVEAGGILKITQDVTDNGGNVWSTKFGVNATGEIVISRKTYLHYANNQFYPGFVIFTDLPARSTPTETYFELGVLYDNYAYEGLNGFYLFKNDPRGNAANVAKNYSSRITPVWDRWFDEKMVYNPESGLLQYYIDNVKQTEYNVGGLEKKNTNFTLANSAYGWWTGHYQYTDDMLVRQEILPPPDEYYKYNYTFRYNEGGVGDYYQGSFYAGASKGYDVGWKSPYYTDETGKKGRYTITSKASLGSDGSKAGQVFVDRYYDSDTSGKVLRPVNYLTPLGLAYLGSESGYIKTLNVADYKFSKTYEADAFNVYTFKYTFGNGDYYTGKVYNSPVSLTYYAGKKWSTANETGKTGTYEITGMRYQTINDMDYGKVFVDWYYDGDTSRRLFRPVNYVTSLGTGNLGSESGYIETAGPAAFGFGKGYYEADYANTYLYKYTYGNGDYYVGKAYDAPTSTRYTLGKKWTVANETGKTGTYEITGVRYATLLAADYGKVFVDWYYDGDISKRSHRPVDYLKPLGTTYIGSELGHIKNAAVSAYLFGLGRYEADAGNTFNFQYSYGNGDYYVGKFYADPTDVSYYPLKTWTRSNETGKTGTYKITGESYSTIASAKYGEVWVTAYYDGEKAKSYAPLAILPGQAFGKYGPGSELGFIGPMYTNPGYLFGLGYYEADGV